MAQAKYYFVSSISKNSNKASATCSGTTSCVMQTDYATDLDVPISVLLGVVAGKQICGNFIWQVRTTRFVFVDILETCWLGSTVLTACFGRMPNLNK